MDNVSQDFDNNALVIPSPNNDTSVSLNDIMTSINLVAESMNIEDINEISTAKFNVLLLNVGMRLINPSRLYYIKYNNKRHCDYNTLNILSKVYVYICFIYNKGISLRGFSNFLGISLLDDNSSYDNLENCLTKLVSFLKKSDNDLQMANARDSKQSILQLAYNNYVHAWNGDIKANEIKSSYKSLDDIRRERLQMSADGVHGEI